MRDYSRLNREIHILENSFGREKVFWDSNGNWVMVQDFRLPPGLNQQTSHVIIVIPERYGNGEPLRDAFLDPGLLVYNPKSGQFEKIPHYFPKYPYDVRLMLGSKEEWQRQNWQYICLHLTPQGSLMTYLNVLYKFLNEPFLDWPALLASYKGSA